MGLPEPIEPNPDAEASPSKDAGRADWLCGAEEGIDAELQRNDRPDHVARPAPKLFRPGADSPADAPSSTPAPRAPQPAGPPLRLIVPSASPDDPDRPGTPHPTALPPPRAAGAVRADDSAPTFSHGPAMLWEPGANSVPALQRVTPTPPPAAPRAQAASPEAAMDFPMDDAEERALASAEAVATAAAAAERASQPHTVVAPDAFDLKDAPMPWWMQIPQMLREDRRVQGGVALVLVVLLALVFWPRQEKSLSLGNIRRHPDRYDGQDVRVSGRIGETFEVGGGWAFYLHQGRDTLVVFTRRRTPTRGQNITLVGTMSTGYLDGQACSAVFESSR